MTCRIEESTDTVSRFRVRIVSVIRRGRRRPPPKRGPGRLCPGPSGHPSLALEKLAAIRRDRRQDQAGKAVQHAQVGDHFISGRSEEHTSELQSLMRISYAVFCLKKKNKTN